MNVLQDVTNLVDFFFFFKWNKLFLTRYRVKIIKTFMFKEVGRRDIVELDMLLASFLKKKNPNLSCFNFPPRYWRLFGQIEICDEH